MKDTTPVGTIRIKTKDLKPYKKTKTSWKEVFYDIHNTLEIINHYKQNNSFEELIDKKDPKFLKGEISPDGKSIGARINILPTGEKLDKAFNLFAKNLTIHDETTLDHWDVLYQNPGGTFAYLYTTDKKINAKKRKYKTVERFNKHYNTIKDNCTKSLKNQSDLLAVPMFTLFKTLMRVGNELYYKTHGHKGLTTLKKKDIGIKGNKVTFSFIAKDGVPMTITETFPDQYVKRLMQMLNDIEDHSFVFTNSNSIHPLTDMHFKEAFKKYCGEEFYPHIVRSHFATMKTKDFIKYKRSISKKEMQELFTMIAEKLGHKKYVKKEDKWVPSYNVTINHYIQPELIEKVKSLVK